MQVNQDATGTATNENEGHETPSEAHVPVLTNREQTRQDNEEALAQVVSY